MAVKLSALDVHKVVVAMKVLLMTVMFMNTLKYKTEGKYQVTGHT